MAKTPKIGCILATLGFAAFFGVVYFEFLSHHNIPSKLGYVKGGLLATVFLLIGVTASDFTYRVTSDYYSMQNLWGHYLSLMMLRLLAAVFYRKLMSSTRQVKRVQEETIMGFLKQNANTEYGRDFNFSKVTSVDDFRKKHPLTRYEHYKSYIKRIHDDKGDGVMGTSKPYILAMTSGTSGDPKMLPTQSKQKSIFFLYGILPLFHVLFEQMEGIRNLQKKLKFFYTPRWRKSPTGIPIGPNSSSPTNSKAELSFHSTPPPAFSIETEPEALYIYLLFGLRDKKLGYLEANFASLIYTAFVSLEKNWRRLVNDIRHGTISPELNIDVKIRNALNSQLTADPGRACELESEFERGFLGVAKKIWPFMNFIMCVDSGAFKVYGDLLKRGYCKGIEIYSPIYAATEGLIGLNLWPTSSDRNYILLPRAMFYEFIPIEESGAENPHTLLLHQVEKDKVYEMVISSSSGLYRYRFGDVVKVKSFQNQTPLVEFMYRQGQLLNVRGEKTSERLFFEAFSEACSKVLPDSDIVDYCCAEQLASTDELSPSYRVYIEVKGPQPSCEQLHQLAVKLDAQLQTSYVYKSFRAKGSISLPTVYLLRPGAFSSLRLIMIDTEKATPNQFKVARVVRKPQVLSLLSSSIQSTSACPN